MVSLNDIYFIWSNEHSGWWGPDLCGYSKGIKGAGEYTHDEAIRICRDALMSAARLGYIAEIPVRRADVMSVLNNQQHIPGAIWGDR